MEISRADVDKYGTTLGCKGCIAAKRKETPKNHTEECRKKIESCIEKHEKVRLDREIERLTRRYAEVVDE